MLKPKTVCASQWFGRIDKRVREAVCYKKIENIIKKPRFGSRSRV